MSDIFKNSYAMSTYDDNIKFIVEGLNVDTDNRTVSLTDLHDKGIDFSLINNPVYDKIYGNIDVISIFKRTKLYDTENRQRDGNPFIYALKNKNGWKFNITNKEIFLYLRRFLEICHKLKDKTFDTIIIVPSNSSLNERFMKIMVKLLNVKNVIKQYVIKLNATDVYDDLVDNMPYIKNDLGDEFPEAWQKIKLGFRKMKGEYFEAKYIPKQYLKYFHYISLEDYEQDISKFINDKRILVLDDIISSGKTVSSCIDAIRYNFMPKSITVLTLLSKLD